MTRDEAQEQITRERDHILLHGGFPAAGHWWASDLITRSRISGLALMLLVGHAGAGPELPAGLTFSALDGEAVPITPTLVLQLLYGIAQQEAAVWAAAQSLLSALQAAPDGAFPAVTAAHWPATYSGG